MKQLRFRRGAILVVVCAVLGAGVGLGVDTVTAPSAQAVTCLGPVNVVEHLNEFRRGVRSDDPDGITVAPNTVDCIHVNSLFVFDTSSGANIEVGWLQTAVSGVCTNFRADVPTGDPYFFEARLTADQHFSCDYNTTPLNVGASLKARASDIGELGTWYFYKNGTQQGRTFVTNWVAGDPAAQGERHYSGDSGNARLRDLEYEDNSGFHSWDNAAAYRDCDSAYGIQVTNFDDVKVFQVNDGYFNLSACGAIL